jgi:hypothetical protein
MITEYNELLEEGDEGQRIGLVVFFFLLLLLAFEEVNNS